MYKKEDFLNFDSFIKKIKELKGKSKFNKNFLVLKNDFSIE
jgi:hypothetical protein